jgi:hypothetical protein
MSNVPTVREWSPVPLNLAAIIVVQPGLIPLIRQSLAR